MFRREGTSPSCSDQNDLSAPDAVHDFPTQRTNADFQEDTCMFGLNAEPSRQRFIFTVISLLHTNDLHVAVYVTDTKSTACLSQWYFDAHTHCWGWILLIGTIYFPTSVCVVFLHWCVCCGMFVIHWGESWDDGSTVLRTCYTPYIQHDGIEESSVELTARS